MRAGSNPDDGVAASRSGDVVRFQSLSKASQEVAEPFAAAAVESVPCAVVALGSTACRQPGSVAASSVGNVGASKTVPVPIAVRKVLEAIAF